MNARLMSSGMPPNKLPNSTGNPVLLRRPMPSMPKPIVTNNPKNGIMMKSGTSSERLVELRELLRREHLVLLDDLDEMRLTPLRMPPE